MGVYFNGNTKLVDTFREIYSHVFTFEANRAILLEVGAPVVYAKELKHCMGLSLNYHKLKHLSLLGA